jgi:hypothetical protein
VKAHLHDHKSRNGIHPNVVSILTLFVPALFDSPSEPLCNLSQDKFTRKMAEYENSRKWHNDEVRKPTTCSICADASVFMMAPD